MRDESMEIYIHIPFCIRKCRYCDFLSFPAAEETREAYCGALVREIRTTAAEVGRRPVSTVYVGGGTPSLLTPAQLQRILDAVRESCILKENAEISMEANPGTLTKEKLAGFFAAGVNRLSIGLQSTDDACLARLGRIHTWKQFRENYALARSLGCENINIDLMSALPGQSLSSWMDTLLKVTALNPEHISAYSLILEEGTPFYEDETVWNALPDEELDREMYAGTKERLAEAGYRRYEISNYAKPGRECRHNLGYWSGVPYLGFGLGASSYYIEENNIEENRTEDGGIHARFSNENVLEKYLARPYIPFRFRKDYGVLTKRERMEDYLIFGLRKMDGVSVREYEARFGTPMEARFGPVIRKYLEMGLLLRSGDTLRLSDAGVDVSDYIFREMYNT